MYVGPDVHKQVRYGTVMNEKREVVKQVSFTNTSEGARWVHGKLG